MLTLSQEKKKNLAPHNLMIAIKILPRNDKFVKVH